MAADASLDVRAGRAAGGEADLAAIGVMLAEPARVRMLTALFDGRALPAGLLASEAGVAPSTASAHLARLVHGGFLSVEQHGRHRYYRLARAEVAAALEQLATLAPVAPIRSLREDTRARALRRARTCYDHLAGELGVEVMSALLDQGVIDGHDGTYRTGVDQLSRSGPDACYALTSVGAEYFANLGVGWPHRGPRPLIRYCVDWSEQRHHLAGKLGAALTAHLFDRGWIEWGAVGRSVRVTARGQEPLARHFGIDAARYR